MLAGMKLSITGTQNSHILQGVIPLGGCSVDAKSEPGQPFSIQISSDEFQVKSY